MYPTLSEFLKTLGINIQLPIQMFGFFVAIAFAVAAYLVSLELKRKQALGILKPSFKKIIVGAPATVTDYVTSAIIGFFIGFKL